MNPSQDSNELLMRGLELFDKGPEAAIMAREFIVQAAELNNPDALHFASLMLSNGWGGEFDRSKAFDYLIHAAEFGHTESIYSLGFCYLNGGMGTVGYSDEILDQQKIVQDIPKALSLLERAAEDGHGLAALRIAEHWENEAEDNPDLLSKAIDWYERGVTLGEPNCLIHLADFLIIGKGFEPDSKQAKRLYKQASKSDDPCASEAAKQRLKDFKELKTILANYY